VIVVLMTICVESFYFGQACLVSRRLPVPEWTTCSLDVANFMLLFLNILHIPLVCISSSMPLIHTFGLLMG
jgi:hypothetical protein